MDHTSNMIESQLFTWDGGWDQFDTAGFSFYNATLITDDFLPLIKGNKFDSINVDYEHSVIEFILGENSWKFQLHLRAGNIILNDSNV